MYKLTKKINQFLSGSNGASLEETIKSLQREVEHLKRAHGEMQRVLHDIQKKLGSAVRNPSLMRFKAFEGNASNQSFSFALLDEGGNGVVVSSLHVRDRISIYGKKINEWESDVELTDEEKSVIKETKNAR